MLTLPFWVAILLSGAPQPLVNSLYTADPSVHIWNDRRIYVYCSHDIETDTPEDQQGSHFDMRDYHVLSMDYVGGSVTIHDVALDLEDVPWASRQLWAPDVAYKNGNYYLYFSAKDHQGIFRLGVAIGNSPTGPFTAEPKPIANSFSIDPAVFQDEDGTHYLYFGGIWGGQLQKWDKGYFDDSASDYDLDNTYALTPYIAKLRDDMTEFAEKPKKVIIIDEEGELLTKNHERRFFEGAWVFKRENIYYLAYSTGNTHYLVYGTADNPYGPFVYQGRILEPVEGWTTHPSIFEHLGKWYLAYHDSQLSGKTHLRNVKIIPMSFDAEGQITHKLLSED